MKLTKFNKLDKRFRVVKMFRSYTWKDYRIVIAFSLLFTILVDTYIINLIN